MKNLIKTLAVVTGITLAYLNGQAQTTAVTGGIYLNEQDYKAGKLSYTMTSSDRLRLNEFLNGKNISVMRLDKIIKLPKSGIFGYRLNNKDYRFYDNKAYAILDTAGFTLYSRQVLIQRGKGYAPVEHYFFSRGNAKSILELTLANLSSGFPEFPEFRYSIQNYFRKDEDLIAFDSAVNQYKLKYLYFGHKAEIAYRSAK